VQSVTEGDAGCHVSDGAIGQYRVDGVRDGAGRLVQALLGL
jgi:hypothetical protein